MVVAVVLRKDRQGSLELGVRGVMVALGQIHSGELPEDVRQTVGIGIVGPLVDLQRASERSARRLANYLQATNALMKVIARACGHARLADFCRDDLTTFNRDLAYLTGVEYAGAVPL